MVMVLAGFEIKNCLNIVHEINILTIHHLVYFSSVISTWLSEHNLALEVN